MTSTSAQALSASLKKLAVSSDAKTKSSPSHTVQDSWEDEEDGISNDEEIRTAEPLSPAEEIPETPPTSPASPSVRTKATSAGSPWQTFPPYGLNGSIDAEPDLQPPAPFSSSRSAQNSDRRPEKTTSVASRLIAAGIGQKAPRRTQEQREYDQAMKLQEKKRRDAAKAAETKAQQEKEKAKLAIWED